MSDAPSQLVRPAAAQPVIRLQRFSGVLAPLNDNFGSIERVMQGAAKSGVEPTFPSILLRAPNGSYFRLSVGDDGTLSTQQVQTAP